MITLTHASAALILGKIGIFSPFSAKIPLKIITPTPNIRPEIFPTEFGENDTRLQQLASYPTTKVRSS
jgi:hypothetical protein